MIRRWIVLLVLLSGSVLFATDRYYIVLWSFEGNPQTSILNTDHWGHSFALYAHVDAQGSNSSLIETRSISWLPRPLIMSPLSGATTGENYSMEETLQIALQKNFVLSRSGPWPISQEYYEAAKEEADRLLSPTHTDRYIMLDRGMRPAISNCYDKIADVGGDDSNPLVSGNYHGMTASVLVLRWLEAHGRISETQDSTAIWLGNQLNDLYHLNSVAIREFRASTRVTDMLGHLLF